jgi:hypothetical protein
MPPKRPDLFAAKIRRYRTPSPSPTNATSASGCRNSRLQGTGSTGQSLAWRVSFDHQATAPSAAIAPPASGASASSPTALTAERPHRTAATEPTTPHRDTTHGAGKRLVLFLGLAYLFLAALASGLVWTVYTAPADRREPEGLTPPAPQGEPEEPTPAAPQWGPDRAAPAVAPLPQAPNAPGLHTRPDGTRYLIMPLPVELADRLRGHGRAFALGSAR